MSLLWGWLLVHLPWWAWGIIIALVWAGLAWAVGMLFGWKYARMMLWPAVALVALVALYVRARQEGYGVRAEEEQGAVDKAVDDFKRHEDAVNKKPIEQIDRENNKWLRP